ncbi:hypothetical protein D3C78_1391320 [compost metagenome]
MTTSWPRSSVTVRSPVDSSAAASFDSPDTVDAELVDTGAGVSSPFDSALFFESPQPVSTPATRTVHKMAVACIFINLTLELLLRNMK